MRDNEKLQEHKNKIMENINYGKQVGINKISAILMLDDENKEEIQKEIVSWLIIEGYKVSLTKNDMDVLVVEWIN